MYEYTVMDWDLDSGLLHMYLKPDREEVVIS